MKLIIIIVPWNFVSLYKHRESSIGKKQIGRSDKKIAAGHEEPRGNSEMATEKRREATSYENLKVSSLEDHPSIRS